MRRIWIVAACLCFVTRVSAEPAEHWAPLEQSARSDAVLNAVQAYSVSQRPTAVMVVHNDRVVASWGDVKARVNVRSVRKSLLSTLYGIAIAEKRIDLSSTLSQLGIDDKPSSLTNAEKRATVRDLLTARSGIYHAAAYETSDMRQKRPARGSHETGTFWYYNNWDFNTLGTIYRQTMNEDIFQSFLSRIAQPIGMEDFSAQDGRYVLEASSSHPAYVFSLSARDLARFGLLLVNDGRWNGRQVIPADWIRQSTSAYSQTDRHHLGYGYLWWTLPSDVCGPGASLASGFGGQFVAACASKHLVITQTVDLDRNRGVHTAAFLDLLRKIAADYPHN